MWSGSGSERTRSITGLNFKGGSSVAPKLADSGGAFSFAKASENALEGLGIEVAGACHKSAGTLTWGGGGL